MKNKILIFLLAIATIAGAAPKISNIEIKNLKELSEDTIREIIPVKAGSTYSNKTLNDIFLSLTRTPLVQNVNIVPTQNGDDVSLTVVVDEVNSAGSVLKRIEEIQKLQEKTDFNINKITYSGTEVNLTELFTKANLKEGDVFVPYNAKLVENLILSTGYFASVETVINRSTDKTVDIEFVVKENPKIKSVNIEGSSLLNEKQLLELSGLKVGQILNTKLLTLEESPIMKAYYENGYLWAGFSDVEVTNDGNVYIKISEGKVKDIVFEKKSTQKENERISEKDYKLKTEKFVLDRNTYIEKGKILNKSNLELTLRELFRTGLFSSLNYEVVKVDEKTDDLIVKVIATERPTTAISANISYSTEDSLTGSLKLSDSNFLGKEQNFDLSGEAGVKGNYNLSFGFRDPWVQGTERLSAGVNVSFRKTTTKTKDLDEFKNAVKANKELKAEEFEKKIYNKPTDRQYVFGINGQIGKGLSSNTSVSATARLLNVHSKNKGEIEGARVYQNYTLGAVGVDLVYDTRDDRAVPKSGLYIDVYNEFGYIFRERSLKLSENGKPIDADTKGEATETTTNFLREKTRAYYTTTIDFRAYHPIYKDKNSMAYRLLLSNSHKNTPSSQLAVVGDGTNLRGLPGVVSNNFYAATLTVENRTYINDYLQLVLFYDGGIASNIRQESEPKNLRFVNTLGIGARINTPIGVVRLDYGWELGNPANKKGKFNFGFGQTF